MKNKKPLTEEYDQWEAWAQRTYRTGGTQPPKSHGVLFSFLLVAVIFLCGVSTALGLMNVRLFRQLTLLSAHEETCSVVFSESAASGEELDYPLGVTGQAVPDFWQNYHNLPAGIYVTKVLDRSDACKKGILPGDILMEVNGTPITDTAILQRLLETTCPGDSVSVLLYRDGQQIALTINLE
jgi:hypothetical protein